VRAVQRFYERYVSGNGKETLLWAFIAFASSIGISRLSVLDAEKGRAIFGYLYIKGYHIHHFYYGLLLLILSSWMALIKYKRLYKRVFKGVASIMFGGGLGWWLMNLDCCSPWSLESEATIGLPNLTTL